MKKRTSIHDIAKELNISATTVSFVLNGKAEEKRISGELKTKVLDYTKAIGYQPNLIAKSLRTGKTKIIGMLVEDIANPFFSSVSRAVEDIAYTLGYKIFFASTENDTEKTKALLKVFGDRQVDGYIIAPPPGIEDDIQTLLDNEIPFILFDRYFQKLHTNNVVTDNLNGACHAVEHLQQNGYKKIGFVTLSSEQIQMNERLNGYVQAIAKKRQKSFILQIPYLTESGGMTKAIKIFLQKNSGLDAVFFGTNYLTIYGLEAITELGLMIPEDLAVVSFDDDAHFRLFRPSITAVAQPVQKISEEVIKKLMACLLDKNGSLNKETIMLPTELMVRNSSGALITAK